MDRIVELLTENIIGIVLLIGALSYLVFGNQLVLDGSRQIESSSTVYTQMERPLEQHLWTGAQVQYLLWSVEDLDYTIAVGAVEYKTLKDVRNNVGNIVSTATFNMKKQVDAYGNIVRVQFTY